MQEFLGKPPTIESLEKFGTPGIMALATAVEREMEEESGLIRKAAEEGRINKRQAKALQRIAQKASQAALEHMLERMSHLTLAKAYKEAKEKNL